MRRIAPALDLCAGGMLDPLCRAEHIREMQNLVKSTGPLTEAQLRLVDDVASMLMAWAVPHTIARLYGYLLLHDEAVSLDRIAEDLQISKSSASVAARTLEKHLLARRYGERGSKRVFYGPTDNYAGVLLEQSILIGSMGRLLKEHATTAVSGRAAKRLKEMSRFYEALHKKMEASIRALSE